PLRRSSRPFPTRSRLLSATLRLLHQIHLFTDARRLTRRESRDLGPRDNESVVGARLLRPLLPFANAVEAVCEVACGLSHASELAQQRRSAGLAVVLEAADQVVRRLPDCDALVRRRIPVGVELIATQQPHLAGAHNENPSLLDALHGDGSRRG